MNFQEFCSVIAGTPLAPLEGLADGNALNKLRHGDLPRWLAMLSALPSLTHSHVDLDSGVTVGAAADGLPLQIDALRQSLQTLIPWRKGPFSLFGIAIDSEWDSGLKWQRLLPHIQPLAGRTVLDVGCGNGYHCLRMAGAGARLVVGVEPYLIYVMQAWAIGNYLPMTPVFVIPASLEQLPTRMKAFDTVFSMGVIYHQRSPLEHLLALRDCLVSGGELVLETLIVDGPPGYSLVPEDRYARMSNVWFLPSCGTLEIWLRRCGFNSVRVVDVSTTGVEEQRQTPWMPFASLADALDSENSSLTIEGLPAPRRAILVCTAS